jgi:hypothetical protein
MYLTRREAIEHRVSLNGTSDGQGKLTLDKMKQVIITTELKSR